MNDYSVLPPELSQAIDRIVKRRSKTDDPVELARARLTYLTELQGKDLLKAAEREVVDSLRGDPKTNPWDVIGDSVWNRKTGRPGITYGAAWSRYASEATTTPESRAEQVLNSQVRSTPSIGVSVAAAMRETGAHRKTIYDHIERNPDAAWFAEVQTTGGGKREKVYRVVDIDGLKKALRGGVNGVSVTQAARQTGISREDIRRCMTLNRDAKWFEYSRPEGARRSVASIVDIEGLKKAVAAMHQS